MGAAVALPARYNVFAISNFGVRPIDIHSHNSIYMPLLFWHPYSDEVSVSHTVVFFTTAMDIVRLNTVLPERSTIMRYFLIDLGAYGRKILHE